MTFFLLDNGADPFLRSRNGHMPIHVAAQYGFSALVEFYLKYVFSGCGDRRRGIPVLLGNPDFVMAGVNAPSSHDSHHKKGAAALDPETTPPAVYVLRKTMMQNGFNIFTQAFPPGYLSVFSTALLFGKTEICEQLLRCVLDGTDHLALAADGSSPRSRIKTTGSCNTNYRFAAATSSRSLSSTTTRQKPSDQQHRGPMNKQASSTSSDVLTHDPTRLWRSLSNEVILECVEVNPAFFYRWFLEPIGFFPSITPGKGSANAIAATTRQPSTSPSNSRNKRTSSASTCLIGFDGAGAESLPDFFDVRTDQGNILHHLLRSSPQKSGKNVNTFARIVGTIVLCMHLRKASFLHLLLEGAVVHGNTPLASACAQTEAVAQSRDLDLKIDIVLQSLTAVLMKEQGLGQATSPSSSDTTTASLLQLYVRGQNTNRVDRLNAIGGTTAVRSVKSQTSSDLDLGGEKTAAVAVDHGSPEEAQPLLVPSAVNLPQMGYQILDHSGTVLRRLIAQFEQSQKMKNTKSSSLQHTEQITPETASSKSSFVSQPFNLPRIRGFHSRNASTRQFQRDGLLPYAGGSGGLGILKQSRTRSSVSATSGQVETIKSNSTEELKQLEVLDEFLRVVLPEVLARFTPCSSGRHDAGAAAGDSSATQLQQASKVDKVFDAASYGIDMKQATEALKAGLMAAGSKSPGKRGNNSQQQQVPGLHFGSLGESSYNIDCPMLTPFDEQNVVHETDTLLHLAIRHGRVPLVRQLLGFLEEHGVIPGSALMKMTAGSGKNVVKDTTAAAAKKTTKRSLFSLQEQLMPEDVSALQNNLDTCWTGQEQLFEEQKDQDGQEEQRRRGSRPSSPSTSKNKSPSKMNKNLGDADFLRTVASLTQGCATGPSAVKKSADDAAMDSNLTKAERIKRDFLRACAAAQMEENEREKQETEAAVEEDEDGQEDQNPLSPRSAAKRRAHQKSLERSRTILECPSITGCTPLHVAAVHSRAGDAVGIAEMLRKQAGNSNSEDLLLRREQQEGLTAAAMAKTDDNQKAFGASK
ncbi:unnamed protein product [Amoebophrya sp. A25]|nr:unnamed protein product [Amoebophrya sp. A25]|eukprot:GSA25T00009421001.1